MVRVACLAAFLLVLVSAQALAQTSSERRRLLDDPDSDTRWGELGEAYWRLGDYAMSSACWGVVRILNPANANWMGRAPNLDLAAWATRRVGIEDAGWVGRLGDRAFAQGREGPAVRLFLQALSLDPDNDEWRARAWRRLPPGPDPEMIWWVRREPHNDEFWGNLGDAYAATGDIAMAEGSWGAAWILDPGDAEWSSRWPNLMQVASTIRALGFVDDEWVGNLADAAQLQGLYAPARALYEVAAEIDPGDGEWLEKARQAFSMGPAPELFEQLRGDPDNDEHWGDLGDAYRDAGQASIAEACWAVARLVDPADPEWAGRGPRVKTAAWGLEQLGLGERAWVLGLADSAKTAGWHHASVLLRNYAQQLPN
jgi:tetratricopeptide (TPR) repeat protein